LHRYTDRLAAALDAQQQLEACWILQATIGREEALAIALKVCARLVCNAAPSVRDAINTLISVPTDPEDGDY
jgi:hypothetical protein